MEGHIQNTQISGQGVSFKHLNGYQQWVLQQVTVEERDSGPSGGPMGRAGEGGKTSTHLYTMPWHTITLPSSEPDAKSGYRGWKATARNAFLWCLWTGSVFTLGSR